jgi:PAS domain S-box-containing protein
MRDGEEAYTTVFGAGLDARRDPCNSSKSPMGAETAETVVTRSGWSALFRDAFNQSRNAMVLLDDERRHVEVNGAYVQLLGYRPSDLIGRPVYELRADHSATSEKLWHAALRRKQFTGTIELLRADGGHVTVEYAGHPEIVTGRRLVLFVALRAARAGRLRDDDPGGLVRADLSRRELEVVKLLAEGLSGPEVAEELRIAHNTVRTHTRNAMTKMNARSRAQLVAKSLAELVYW